MTNTAAPNLTINGTGTTVRADQATLSLLDYLREVAQLKGTKEGCASGDCGACTVMVDDGSRVSTANSCITPTASVLGQHVTTVEGLGTPQNMHPVQAAMVACHGSQCGYCTPGFVVSMAADQLARARRGDSRKPEREDLVTAISGNLCRCTGYRPILEAFEQANAAPSALLPEPTHLHSFELPANVHCPRTLNELRPLLGRGLPLVAGATDLWLEVTQRLTDFAGLVDVAHVAEMKAFETRDGKHHLGASLTHAELEAIFSDAVPSAPVVRLLHRFGSPQVRARATLGGNIANASPIADWPPILIIGEGEVVLENADGTQRTMPLEAFYTGYRQTHLAADEFISGFTVRADMNWQNVTIEKVSKRWEDDISSVLGAFAIEAENGTVSRCRIAYGGVAATPVRLHAVEDLLLGATLSGSLPDAAEAALRAALTPLSDVRASAQYRTEMALSLLRLAWANACGTPSTQLEVGN